MKILLVDDSKTMRNIQRKTLTQLGYEQLDEACDGQEALAKAEDFQPDLILLDWNMPVMDGITFVRAFRGQGDKTPIIMVTTEAEKERVLEAIKAGVNNYVVKPFTPDELAQRVATTMAKAAA
ncbi:MAG: response regulator [bacterium]|nr:response regulator [bacterium]